MDELRLITEIKYAANNAPKTKQTNQNQKKVCHTCKYDEFSLIADWKYGQKKEVNIFPIDVDFPLPQKFVGEENRLNSPYNLEIPQVLSQRNKSETLVGSILRVDYVLANAAKYLDKNITVAGWANSARLQENDTLLFIELVDGTSPVPLQIVVKSTTTNFADLKKTKRSYSFRISGKVIKSLGKGQEI